MTRLVGDKPHHDYSGEHRFGRPGETPEICFALLITQRRGFKSRRGTFDGSLSAPPLTWSTRPRPIRAPSCPTDFEPTTVKGPRQLEDVPAFVELESGGPRLVPAEW
jgi:hypothetical protein